MTSPGVLPTAPEIGADVRLGDVIVNVLEAGSGSPVLLIHGSGPGVTAWANWRTVLPRLDSRFRLIAPDMIGFGYTEAPETAFDMDAWVGQVTGLLDALGIERCAIIGNSFGGAVALHVASRYPERVDRLVLMGPVGTSFPITDALDAVWGYVPSFERMAALMNAFAYDTSVITDDLVSSRLAASSRPTVQERFSQLFPAPRQQWVDALALEDESLGRIEQPVLIVHGRQDLVIPIEASERLCRLLPDARLHRIDRCGHWVQIEHADEFCNLVSDFLSTDGEEQ